MPPLADSSGVWLAGALFNGNDIVYKSGRGRVVEGRGALVTSSLVWEGTTDMVPLMGCWKMLVLKDGSTSSEDILGTRDSLGFEKIGTETA